VWPFVRAGAKVVSRDVFDDLGEPGDCGRQCGRARVGSLHARGHLEAGSSLHCGGASVKELGERDALFNIVGAEHRAATEQIPEGDLDLILNVNAKGTIFTKPGRLFVRQRPRRGDR